jgi:hypothetical protein
VRAESREQRECREQRTESREQRAGEDSAESKEQRAESREQKAESREQREQRSMSSDVSAHLPQNVHIVYARYCMLHYALSAYDVAAMLKYYVVPAFHGLLSYSL